MTQVNTVTSREILRNYKEVFDRVKNTNQRTIVVSHKEPQVAIVSLDDLKQLQQMQYKNSTRNLLNFTTKAREVLKEEKLPKDLAAKHDKYLWQG
ncbi:MAG: type II toxin-antitoxin system prevent-host-death family antitoxin [Candidatus Saccharimonadales bacterium]